MKPKKDPIKPSKLLTKKPNFKKEELEDEFIKVSLAGLYGQFRSPGVYTREVDIVYNPLDHQQDIFIPQRDEGPQIQHDGERRVFNINVGELGHDDVADFTRRIQQSMGVPPRYLGHSESPIVSPQEIRTYQEFQRLFGGPIGVSSRSRQRPDGDIELLGYDLVASPPTPSAILGGEEMSYNASTWMTLNKKKTRWERVKDYFSSIYKRWRRVG